MHRLLEKAQGMKDEVDKILSESELVEILSQYGEVKIGGSYALDLMLRPDIDIFVITDKHDWEKVLKVTTDLMTKRYFREVCFVNWVDFDGNTKKDFMKGYYFQPLVQIGESFWKIDLWLTTKEYYKPEKFTDRFQTLLDKETDNAKRITIMEIKEAMREGKKYRGNVNGKMIYEAVLENGVKSVDDFERFAKIEL